MGEGLEQATQTPIFARRRSDRRAFLRSAGGQQRRFAIVRALDLAATDAVRRATSALDPEMVGEVLGVMRRLHVAAMTMIVVTHEVAFARDVADRVVFMDEGRIIEQGPPSQVLGNPREDRTRRFLRMVERGDNAPDLAAAV